MYDEERRRELAYEDRYADYLDREETEAEDEDREDERREINRRWKE